MFALFLCFVTVNGQWEGMGGWGHLLNYLGNLYGTVGRNLDNSQWSDPSLGARGRNYVLGPVRTPGNGRWYGGGGRFSHGPVDLPGNIRVTGNGMFSEETRTWGNQRGPWGNIWGNQGMNGPWGNIWGNQGMPPKFGIRGMNDATSTLNNQAFTGNPWILLGR